MLLWLLAKNTLVVTDFIKIGASMWMARLRDNYKNNFEAWLSYSEMYGLADRLRPGSTAENLWEENPRIQGSVCPSDFQIVSMD